MKIEPGLRFPWAWTKLCSIAASMKPSEVTEYITYCKCPLGLACVWVSLGADRHVLILAPRLTKANVGLPPEPLAKTKVRALRRKWMPAVVCSMLTEPIML